MNAAPRPCRIATCPHLVTADQPCPEHGRRVKPGRGSTRSWRTRRRFVLRDAPLCVVCRAAGRVGLAVEVDHVQPVGHGGSHEYDNLQPLCHAHHAEKTAGERRPQREAT